jgi:predicted enzyme related to lactoylglutathione lyase
MHGKFYWNELMTRDVEASKKFFADTVGWTYDRMPTPEGSGTYWIAKSGSEPVGGMFPIDDPKFAPLGEAWLGYIGVDDVDARFKKALKAGAKAMREPFDIPGVGRIAIVTDPRGSMTPVPR